jgi:hypothetical protein
VALLWVVDAINPILGHDGNATIAPDKAVRRWAKLAGLQLIATYELLANHYFTIWYALEILTSHPEARVDNNTGLISVQIPLDTSVVT